MKTPISPEFAERHNALFKEAVRLAKQQVMLEDVERSALDVRGRQSISEANALLLEVVRMNPGNVAAIWWLGKLQQRLGLPEKAAALFSLAADLDPSNPDVLREAYISASALGDTQAALRFASLAVDRSNDDPGLRSNLALAYLAFGDLKAALREATKSVEMNPSDEKSAKVLSIVHSRIEGDAK